MTRLAYLDCPTGIAGDMCLGALVSAGVPLNYLAEQLDRLGIGQEFQLRAELVHRNGQAATKVYVDLQHSQEKASRPSYPASTPAQHPAGEGHRHGHAHHHEHSGHDHSHHDHSHHDHTHALPPLRHLPEIEQMIKAAELPPRATEWSLQVFRKLAQAEGAVHGLPPEQVHFHEVGATDAIVDIVGTCLGLDWLGIDELYCSALPTGGGTIRAAHGRLPVPVPAVLKLWEQHQTPIYSNGIDRELVTPTGAAIAVTLATRFGPPPAMTLQTVGLGAGTIDLPLPNILRLWLGEQAGPAAREHRAEQHQPGKLPSPLAQETVAVLETQIDDLSPQAIGYTQEALFAAGAVDVFTQAVAMKKSRPGVLLTVICLPPQVEACEAVLFRETTTLGVRRSLQQRTVLRRQIETVKTDYGPVRLKLAWSASSDRPSHVHPEYEDCATIARQHQIPWRQVHRLALQAWYEKFQSIEQFRD